MSKAKKVKVAREVLFEEVVIQLCTKGSDDGPVTVEDAKQLLGWEEEGNSKFGSDFLLKDDNGNKIRCMNNVTNRPLNMANVKTLIKDILLGYWTFNGETIIIGRTGLVLNGQHQLVALILASQIWEKDKGRWSYWKEEPTIDKLVVSGVDESDGTVNTMDTCKPRALWEVICRSDYFSTLKEAERQKCSKICEWAIKCLKHRTAADPNAFSPKWTHAESLGFLMHHPRILEAVKHIYEEDGGEGKISKMIPLGQATTLLYLMAASKTEGKEYRQADPPQEKLVDFSDWDLACKFFVLLAGHAIEMKPVREAWVAMNEEGKDGISDRTALLINAWNAFQDSEKIKPSDLILEYESTEDGHHVLLDHPIIGGIDVGSIDNLDEEEINVTDPDREEINERKQQVRQKKEKSEKPTPRLVPKKEGKEWAASDVAWVRDQDGDHYIAVLQDDPWQLEDNSGRSMVTVVDGSGNEWEVDVENLFLTHPDSQTPESKLPSPKKNTTWKSGDVAWVKEKSGEDWRGKILTVDDKKAKLQILTGFQGAGNLKIIWTKNLSKKQPVLA